ncbi:MAG: alpha/beta hydrolase [Pricia sp.]|nr:alpha/beta hydrolase [Pricia sp.]
MRILSIIILIITISCNQSKSLNESEYYLTLENHEIHVKHIGKGSPILFAHGGYLDLEMWNSQIDAFKNSHKLIRFTDLGHGQTIRSGKSIYGYNIIESLTRKYPYEKFDLVGLSWGAMLCVDFALKYPERVNKLILVSPGLNGWSYFKDSLALKNYNQRQKAIERNDISEAGKLFHQTWAIGPRREQENIDKSFRSESFEMILKNMQNHWLENWSELDTVQAISRLEQIESPTYVIIGDQDAQDIHLIAEEYTTRIKNAKKMVVSNFAHLVNMEDPKRFNTLLQDILKE